MTANLALERRYRRLLGLYPPTYRKEYTEEVLGVLMESAQDGSARPSLADSIDLARGAVAVRVRSALRGGTGADWQDALALFTVTAPLFAVAIFSRPFAYRVISAGELPQIRAWFAGGLVMNLLGLGAQLAVLVGYALIPAILGFFRLRRMALLAATALIAISVVGVFWRAGPPILVPDIAWRLGGPAVAMFQIILAMEALALLKSPGPRRGLRLMTWKGWLIAVWWLATAVAVDRAALGITAPAVIGCLGVLGSLASGRVRRLAALLMIPASALMISSSTFGVGSLMTATATAMWAYLVPAVLASLVYAAFRRAASRRTASRGVGGQAPTAEA
jgi:hypothetical protein